jgi:Abnormal spindle-like microcephaly-assoc'd, ASPM-SPD-2-Hydin
MLLFPQFTGRASLSLSLCLIAIFSSPTLALAENNSAARPGAHAEQTQLTRANTKLRFGEVVVGQTSDKLTTITNRSAKPLKILSAVSTGTDFGMKGLDVPLTLAAGESFTFGVTFAPHSSGPEYGSIAFISDSPKQPLTISLAGTGRATGKLGITPEMIAFGDVSAGMQSTQIGHLTASTASVTISSANINNEKFHLGGLSLPITIPAGHSVLFTVTFISKSIGNTSGTLSFASDAENSPPKQVMTVRVTGPVRHKVQLSWKPSKSKHIAGYNVYRSNRAGGPYKKINHSLDPSTNYTDRHVVAGCKYYYVARAVNRKGLESKYSKQVQAAIPCDHVITDGDWQRGAALLLTYAECANTEDRCHK